MTAPIPHLNRPDLHISLTPVAPDHTAIVLEVRDRFGIVTRQVLPVAAGRAEVERAIGEHVRYSMAATRRN